MTTKIPRRAGRLALLLSLPALLAGCYPDHTDGLEELEIVMTAYDTTCIFDSIRTYIMPDTVIAITDPDHPDNNTPYDHSRDSLILSEMAANLEARGYQRVADTLSGMPDAGILLNVSSAAYWGGNWHDWHDYWSWYPYWPASSDDGYGYYYPWTATYNYTVGTLVVQMTDLRGLHATDTVRVIWLGAVNGLVNGEALPQRIPEMIGQLFIQSPYL